MTFILKTVSCHKCIVDKAIQGRRHHYGSSKSRRFLGLVVGLKMLQQVAAGLVGVFVPMDVNVLRIDPALASPVTINTFTRMFGYHVYLLFATIVLIQFVS